MGSWVLEIFISCINYVFISFCLNNFTALYIVLVGARAL
jgi:hypothetical protein